NSGKISRKRSTDSTISEEKTRIEGVELSDDPFRRSLIWKKPVIPKNEKSFLEVNVLEGKILSLLAPKYFEIPVGRTKAETLLLETKCSEKYEDVMDILSQIKKLRQEQEALFLENAEKASELWDLLIKFQTSKYLLIDTIKGTQCLTLDDCFLDVRQLPGIDEMKARKEMKSRLASLKNLCDRYFHTKFRSFNKFHAYRNLKSTLSCHAETQPDCWSIAETIDFAEKIKEIEENAMEELSKVVDLIHKIIDTKSHHLENNDVIKLAKVFDEISNIKPSEKKENHISHVEYYSNLRPFKFRKGILERLLDFQNEMDAVDRENSN
ncbi:hypothetical protein ROZALSC1DRAFT_28407, partial [Rozella allomycis CSF55]